MVVIGMIVTVIVIVVVATTVAITGMVTVMGGYLSCHILFQIGYGAKVNGYQMDLDMDINATSQ